MQFFAADANGVLSEHANSQDLASLQETFSEHASTYDVWCFPLSSLLAAMNHSKRIDYFALDVEGSELNILQGLPWDKLQFGVIQVNIEH